MKLKYLLFAGTVLLELFLALSPVLPITAALWSTDTPGAFYTSLATAIGIQFTLLTATIGLLVIVESSELRKKVMHSLRGLGGPVVRQIRDDEFYQDFLLAAKRATSAVRISYFAPYPPDRVGDDDRNDYYLEITNLMRKNRGVKFKRLVRFSPANTPWILELITAYAGSPNLDLAIIRGDLDSSVEMPLALSVQVIDSLHVWFVAVAAHEREGHYRDVYIESGEVGIAMEAYFTRLWDASAELLQAGVLTNEGRKFVSESQQRESA